MYQELLYSTFSKYGLMFGTQVFPYAPRPQQLSPPSREDKDSSKQPGYYAFVNFYLAMSARQAKDDLNGKITLHGAECKVGFVCFCMLFYVPLENLSPVETSPASGEMPQIFTHMHDTQVCSSKVVYRTNAFFDRGPTFQGPN